MDAQRCANTLKSLKQVSSFRNESKTATLTKSKPCSHVLSCLAMFYNKVFERRDFDVSLNNNCCLFLSCAPFFFLDRALYAIAFSVLDIGVIYLWPWV